VVVSFGGEWQKAQTEAMMKPFATANKVRITPSEYGGDYELLAQKLGSGAWDVVDVEPAELLRAAGAGILEKIDYTKIRKAALIPSAVHDFGIGLMTYSIVLGFNSITYPSSKPRPSSWADFWDLDKFPGKRAMHNSPQWMLEIALLADGVSAEKLYPLDVERAFSSLDKIKSQLITYESWAQPTQLLLRGDVVMSVGTSGRLLAAKEEGKPIQISWENGIVASDYWVIGKGSQNKELAQAFVSYSVSDEAQSAMAKYILYGPSNTNALSSIAANRRSLLPTAPEHFSQQVRFDAEWWYINKKRVLERWNGWLLSPAK
jgi:putative spermidine/putrescine transport system substrate-binding protein